MGKERRFDLLVVGELNVDLILRGAQQIAFGQVERLLDDATLALGSSSAICACGAARLGLRVAFAGTVGDDLFGHFVLEALADRGVDTSAVRVKPTERTGIGVILIQGDDRAILTYSGSIATTRATDLDLAMLDEACHLHLGGYYLLDALRPDVAKLFMLARQRGLSTSLDTNYDPREDWDGGVGAVLANCDLFLPNEAELLAITRRSTIGMALTYLSQPGLTIVVKRGARGALAHRATHTFIVPAPPVQPVDTVGAGDSFDAGLIYGHLAGWDLEQSVRLATTCGSLSTLAAGGTSAQPSLAEALAAL